MKVQNETNTINCDINYDECNITCDSIEFFRNVYNKGVLTEEEIQKVLNDDSIRSLKGKLFYLECMHSEAKMLRNMYMNQYLSVMV